ncbi:hypothetical protein [Mesorhizobium sp. M1406]
MLPLQPQAARPLKPPAKADRADVAGLVELLTKTAPTTCGKVGAPR